MLKTDSFTNNFQPYRKTYTYQYHSKMLNGNLWYTTESYLSDLQILQAITALKTYGYYITHSTIILGIDMDDHKNLGTGYLLSIYNQVVTAIGQTPSLLFKTPQGLHAYYLFNQNIPTDIIVNQAKQKLSKLPVEVKPTQNTSIRIPAETSGLDPVTMDLVNLPFELLVTGCKKYHPAELFTESLPDNVRLSLKEKRTTIKKFKAIPKIEKIESEVLPFTNGSTNESFLKLCNVYRVNRLDQDEAFYRFKLCLLRSPYYTGDLWNEKRLISRINCEYKNNQFTPNPKDFTPSLFNMLIAESIEQEYKRALLLIYVTAVNENLPKNIKRSITNQSKRMKKFVMNLLNWLDYQDEIWEHKTEVAIWDFIYKYYRKNRKRGLYPLPTALMETWNDRYYTLVKALIEMGILKESEYQYSARLHICKYYHVDFSKYNK